MVALAGSMVAQRCSVSLHWPNNLIREEMEVHGMSLMFMVASDEVLGVSAV